MAEPVIQQQGLDRIVVQLPGVQDTAKAKDILGRTATLEMRLVDESAEGRAAETGSGPVPFGSEKFLDREGRPVIVKKQVLVTGENLTDAQPGFDSQTQQPKVDLTMDAKGGAHHARREPRELPQAHGDAAVREGQGRGADGAVDPRRARQPLPDLRAR